MTAVAAVIASTAKMHADGRKKAKPKMSAASAAILHQMQKQLAAGPQPHSEPPQPAIWPVVAISLLVLTGVIIHIFRLLSLFGHG